MKIKEMGLPKTQPQQTGKNCFKSAYCYNNASHIVEKSLICTLSRHSAVSYVLCYLKEVCKQANLIALTTQLADYHAHLDTVKITCELES